MSDLVAKEDIPFGDPGRGVFAFRRGDSVPAALAKDNQWDDYVVGAGTKEARQIRADLTGEQVEETAKTTAATAGGKSTEQRG